MFPELPAHLLPKSDTFANDPNMQAGGTDLNFIASVVDRWRSATMNRAHVDEQRTAAGTPRALGTGAQIPSSPALAAVPPGTGTGTGTGIGAGAAGAAGVDPSRFNLLKKPPAEQRPDPLAALRALQATAAQR
jgi:hypothetical protein